MTKVVSNKHGAAISIVQDDTTISASITVVQKLYEKVPEGIIIEERTAQLLENIDRIISLNLLPGDKLKGNIIIQKDKAFYSENPEDVDILY